MRSRAPTVIAAAIADSRRSGTPWRNFGPFPCSSQDGSIDVSSMIFRMTSAGTVTPAS